MGRTQGLKWVELRVWEVGKTVGNRCQHGVSEVHGKMPTMI